jgi:hypothetical protein
MRGKIALDEKKNEKTEAVTTAKEKPLHFRQEYRRKRAGVMR